VVILDQADTSLEEGDFVMPQATGNALETRIWRPCGRAFFVSYVAMAIFFFGPHINPEVGLSPRLGFILGLIVVAAVAYMWTQEYHLTNKGLSKVWRWPARRQEIPWENIGEIQVRRGFTQSLLRVGNLSIQDKTGEPMMIWFGLSRPKEVYEIIEKNRP
jgi:hypothetical protein